MPIGIVYLEAQPNVCDFIYCENKGSCGQNNKTLLGFQCQCQFGFTGLLCESRLNVTSKE
jgi:hypothetical protein